MENKITSINNIYSIDFLIKQFQKVIDQFENYQLNENDIVSFLNYIYKIIIN